jgi:starvation-inducible DNA-binding protein
VSRNITTVEVGTVIGALQRQIANAFALYINYKRYHWRVYGPLFRDLHLMFDDHAEAVLATIDELGERVRILGGEPVATLEEIIDAKSVLAPATKERAVRTMIDEAAANHRRVIAEMRDGVEVAQRAGDPGTTDLFTRLVQVHEKQEWFLREVVAPAPDGLVQRADRPE